MAESSDLSTTLSSSTGKLDNVVYYDVLKLAKNEIIRALDLEEHERKDEIINDLLKNGRQSLFNYEDDLVPDIYEAAVNENDGDLMKSLKNYFEQQWKVEYGSSNQWFILFLKTYEDDANYGSYKCVLNRTAEYGNKYLKSCPILSIVLQLLFEGIDDQCLNDTNVFDDLWFTITNDGLKSIEKFSDYVSEDEMLKLINKEQLALFQALREYYRPELFQLLEQSSIANRQNLYELTLDNVAEYGWLKGLQAVQKKIIPRYFKTLLAKIPSQKQQQTTESEDKNGGTTIAASTVVSSNASEKQRKFDLIKCLVCLPP
ncbi:unnamed protein product [Rotaria sp. Silwood2]|nr:unnamed protein product [Rotaria sp. Silwood2]CAF2797856.1 unnamed protein product [Rotaria sp. Silwood2]CAF3074957.1 unnamed protein product [Rotaria sp. Silwood2]CAF3231674.1 unnamed protein product [Rotaria sp. Silwood2]CAF4321812.1 unnamed protein product [Rotaria sp. Silwood2]